MMKPIAAFLLLGSPAMAQIIKEDWTGPMAILGGSIPYGLEGRSADVVKDAVTRPNTTNSQEFSLLFDKTDTDWTWRINVTDIALPHLEGQLEGDLESIVNPHLISISYDFEWPGGGNMSQAMGDFTGSFCVTSIVSPISPYGDNGLPTTDGGNGNGCESVLGPDCVKAILKGSNSKSSNECVDPSLEWHRIPECNSALDLQLYSMSTFDVHGKIDGSFYTALRDGSANTTRYSGSGFYGRSTGVVNGSEAPGMYAEFYDQLHVMMVGYAHEGKNNTQLLCMRPNGTTSSDEEPTPTGTSTGTTAGPASPTGTSAALYSTRMSWSVVGISGAVFLAMVI
ncbi:uncharacterized protein CTRU02_202675 [Colletotrichum truncatum]|uniref:Uncharacterized protein n=1 Tax=Colletotrichum truncatum TaxID=5467 RepID=A0ACC3ZLK6_COLTU|nr:uncharacterized protein CTRU02_10598 [Colletotrichum truncatum]KAF6786899.1 hypothetical protein CTRU02_10598 [Colletotrichum truncatum]